MLRAYPAAASSSPAESPPKTKAHPTPGPLSAPTRESASDFPSKDSPPLRPGMRHIFFLRKNARPNAVAPPRTSDPRASRADARGQTREENPSDCNRNPYSCRSLPLLRVNSQAAVSRCLLLRLVEHSLD